MAFYTDKWVILEKDEKDIRLFRKINKDVTMDKIVGEVEKNDREYLCEDTFKEYDVGIDNRGHIYLLYQNSEMNLILKILKEDKIEMTKLTDKPIGEIVHLNIAIINDKINILYVIATIEKDNYEIYHHCYNNKRWKTYLVDKINKEKVLNTINVLIEEEMLILSYISAGDILISTFSFKDLKWNKNIKVSNTHNEKLFLDIIKIDDLFHLTYCEFIDDNLVIKYKKFSVKNMDMKIIQENIISSKGSPSYPTIISYNNRIWITWIELNKVTSRMLDENEKDWGPIYLWEESINKDIIRYKYIRKNKDKDTILNYSFGKAYPEVQFIGFGPINNAKKISMDSDEVIFVYDKLKVSQILIENSPRGNI